MDFVQKNTTLFLSVRGIAGQRLLRRNVAPSRISFSRTPETDPSKLYFFTWDLFFQSSQKKKPLLKASWHNHLWKMKKPFFAKSLSFRCLGILRLRFWAWFWPAKFRHEPKKKAANFAPIADWLKGVSMDFLWRVLMLQRNEKKWKRTSASSAGCRRKM